MFRLSRVGVKPAGGKRILLGVVVPVTLIPFRFHPVTGTLPAKFSMVTGNSPDADRHMSTFAPAIVLPIAAASTTSFFPSLFMATPLPPVRCLPAAATLSRNRRYLRAAHDGRDMMQDYPAVDLT